MKRLRTGIAITGVVIAVTAACSSTAREVADQAEPIAAVHKPNILFIMADDVGWFNIGAYHQGMMASRTPNIDQLAAEGTRFTDYYAEPSCTAGRANFITGELPIRTGLTTVGQAGAEVGIPDRAITIATALQSTGYATGQFGKNHLGDLNKYLPTVHGFDEFHGYLYHLNAMEDPYWHSYPQDQKDKIGPRNVIHSWATDKDDATEEPRWGKVGKQRIEDNGPLPPERMKTVDNEFLESAIGFMRRSKEAGKPFFAYLNPTRMHVNTHLSERYASMQTPENSWYTYEAGMAQLDDIVGAAITEVKNLGLTDDTIVVFTTDNGAEVMTWPDGGITPFAGEKGTVLEGGMRVPMLVKWPGKVPASKVENSVMSGLDWFPTFASVAGNPNIVEELLRGKRIGDTEYKVHLDGYDQLDLLTGRGPTKRDKVWYFAEGTLGAARIGDWKFRFIEQPQGWLGGTTKVNWPIVGNLRLDPFERTDPSKAPPAMKGFYEREMWRFVFIQDEVGKLAKTFADFPPMQKRATFNLDAVKEQLSEAMSRHQSD
jgi:arylsulfatase